MSLFSIFLNLWLPYYSDLVVLTTFNTEHVFLFSDKSYEMVCDDILENMKHVTVDHNNHRIDDNPTIKGMNDNFCASS